MRKAHLLIVGSVPPRAKYARISVVYENVILPYMRTIYSYMRICNSLWQSQLIENLNASNLGFYINFIVKTKSIFCTPLIHKFSNVSLNFLFPGHWMRIEKLLFGICVAAVKTVCVCVRQQRRRSTDHKCRCRCVRVIARVLCVCE